jgi:3',5'-cyclic AMP phosphodiesterase CpdA
MRGARSALIALLSLAIMATGLPAQAQSTPSDAVIVGAGDIAGCNSPGDEETAQLLDHIEGTVFTAGDNVYPSGTADEFKNCYGPSWGQFKKRTRPALGNHEYATRGAVPYFEYFGWNAGPGRGGYYSYNLGAWHVIVLNSNIDARIESFQGKWLRDDLKANPAVCTLAYWHHPLFSSYEEKDRPRDIQAMWRMLYESGVDVVINGHVHAYERFAPQNPDGEKDLEHGIRELIVGTGGASLANKRPISMNPNSEVWDNSTWGVLKLTLHPTSYDWEFLPVKGGTFHDSGSGQCVAPGQ